MTKFKSKKITKSTIAVIIMAIAMVAMLAFGGTYALFTATTGAKTVNVVTGKVSLSAAETFTVTTTNPILPGDELFAAKAIKYNNESTVSSYVAIKIELKKGETPLTVAELNTIGLNLTVGTDWVEAKDNSMVYVHKEAVAAGTAVEFNNAPIIFQATENFHDGVSEAGANASVENITLTFVFYGFSVQSRGLGIAEVADNADIASPEQAKLVYEHMNRTKIAA